MLAAPAAAPMTPRSLFSAGFGAGIDGSLMVGAESGAGIGSGAGSGARVVLGADVGAGVGYARSSNSSTSSNCLGSDTEGGVSGRALAHRPSLEDPSGFLRFALKSAGVPWTEESESAAFRNSKFESGRIPTRPPADRTYFN